MDKTTWNMSPAVTYCLAFWTAFSKSFFEVLTVGWVYVNCSSGAPDSSSSLVTSVRRFSLLK